MVPNKCANSALSNYNVKVINSHWDISTQLYFSCGFCENLICCFQLAKIQLIVWNSSVPKAVNNYTDDLVLFWFCTLTDIKSALKSGVLLVRPLLNLNTYMACFSWSSVKLSAVWYCFEIELGFNWNAFLLPVQSEFHFHFEFLW